MKLTHETESRLAIGCSHAHTFGRCVNNYSRLPLWVDYTDVRSLEEEDIAKDLSLKLSFIRQRLVEVGTSAIRKGLQVQCITEHPQFGFYGIPFYQYLENVRPIINDFERGKYGRPLAMPWGIEVELVPDGERITASVASVNDPKMYGLSDMRMLREAQVIVGGIHQKFFRDEKIYDTKDYGNVLIQGILGLDRLRQQLESEGFSGKKYILAHPWHCASDLHRYQGRSDLRMDLGENLNTRIAELLIDRRIAPEFNIACVERGRDELSSQYSNLRGETSIIGTYCERSVRENSRPVLAIGTDAHTVDRVGKIDLSRLGTVEADAINDAVSVLEQFIL